MRRPTDNQLAVADACERTSAMRASELFGISLGRVHEICRIVRAYRQWAHASAANEELPVDQRLVRFLPLSNRTLGALTHANFETVGDLARLSKSELNAIPGAGKTAASEVLAYLARHKPASDGVVERMARRLALQAFRRGEMAPGDHGGVIAWVETHWPQYARDAKQILADLKTVPIMIVERAATQVPAVDANNALHIWRAMIGAILSQ